MKNRLLRDYRALSIGGITTLILTLMLTISEDVYFVVINPSYVSTPVYYCINALVFILCWWVISFLIQNYRVYKVLGVVSLLVIAIIADRYMDFASNPITIPLGILFWIGIAYLILPQFFKKYKFAVLSVYGFVIAYFLFFNLGPNYNESNRQTFLHLLIIPIPVFFSLWLYEQWRWLKTLQADKDKAELSLLKSQVDPHFFFNTLNNLYGLVVEKSEAAPDVVLKLSEMMRYTIYKGKEDLVPLKEEISYLNNYIELHKIRYQKKVEITFTHDVAEGLKIAPLLFIILLENAFKHGVENIRENAFIRMDMRTQDNHLYFTIENSIKEQAPTHEVGIGLENLKQRLDHLYGNQYEMTSEIRNASYKAHLNISLM